MTFRTSRVRLSITWAVWAAVVLLSCPACQQQMAEQPSYRPFKPSGFFADGQSARPLVPGTVERGELRLDRHFFTGLRGPDEGGAPLPGASVEVFGGQAVTAGGELTLPDSYDVPWEVVPGTLEGLKYHTTLRHFSRYGLAQGKAGW